MNTISYQRKERNRRRVEKVAKLLSDGEWYSIYDLADEIEESTRIAARIVMQLNVEKKQDKAYGRIITKYRLKENKH